MQSMHRRGENGNVPAWPTIIQMPWSVEFAPRSILQTQKAAEISEGATVDRVGRRMTDTSPLHHTIRSMR